MGSARPSHPSPCPAPSAHAVANQQMPHSNFYAVRVIPLPCGMVGHGVDVTTRKNSS